MNRPHVFLDLKQGNRLLGTHARFAHGLLWHKSVCVLPELHSVIAAIGNSHAALSQSRDA